MDSSEPAPMRMPVSRPSPNDVTLATTLAALASPVRLAILRELRRPRGVTDIRVTHEEDDDAQGDEEATPRPLSRQAVRQHLDRLLEVGVVSRVGGERGPSPTTAYLVEHRKLFAAAEELRMLAALRPMGAPLDLDTEETFPRPGGRTPRGPRLVLVRGLNEGSVFRFADIEPDGGCWVIGRSPEAAICLDYDPFVSHENALVRQRPDGRFAIEDVPGSRNGTSVNYARLPPDEPATLRHGDLVTLGHTSLLYWDD